MDLDVVARAKAYPFDPPASSFVLEDGAVRALDLRAAWRDVAGRRPVLACGSNQSPARLRQKFTNGEGPVLVTKVTVEDLDAVFAAHIASYGAVPATLIPAPGTRVSLAITWLTPLQERVMHATEAVGVIYDYVRLTGIAAELEDGRRVEPVDHHPVDALVDDQHQPAGRVERDEVGVRAGLGRAGAGALVAHHVAGRPEPAILADREHPHRAILVVGHEQEAPTRVGAKVAGVAALARLPAEEGERPALRIDRERRDRPGRPPLVLPRFVDGEEEAMARVEGQERGIDHPAGRVQVGQDAGRRLLAVDGDARAGARRWLGVAPDVDEIRLHGSSPNACDAG